MSEQFCCELPGLCCLVQLQSVWEVLHACLRMLQVVSVCDQNQFSLASLFWWHVWQLQCLTQLQHLCSTMSVLCGYAACMYMCEHVHDDVCDTYFYSGIAKLFN